MLSTRTLREWISSLPVLLLIVMVMAISLNEKMYSQMLRVGEQLFGNYYILRVDIPTPSCDPKQDIDQALEEEIHKQKAAQQSDEFGDLFGDSPIDTDALRVSLEGQRQACVQQHEMAKINQERVTDDIRAFRVLDHAMLAIGHIGRDSQQLILLALIFICGLTATMTNHHISLRPLQNANDYRVSGIAQTIANLSLAISAWEYLQIGANAGVPMQNESTRWGYVIVFCLMTGISLLQSLFVPKSAAPGGGIGKALLSIPLYAYATFGAAYYFLIASGNKQGLVLHVDRIMDAADLFTKISLLIWAGLLIKQTHIGELVFRIFKPWRLPPELLAFVAIFLMAVPTAYTGASGAIIVAMGGVVYNELRRAGARRNLALATTAMTGSLGVVLKPCLLVLIIAFLNKEVTTDDLFHWGSRVFIMTSFIFFVIALIAREEKLSVAPTREALVPSLKAFIPLFPYVILVAITLLLFYVLLDVKLDENTAAIMVPMIVLVMVIYEKLLGKKRLEEQETYHDEERQTTAEGAIRVATSSTAELMGGLMLLIALSMSIGGVIEETHIIQNAAEHGGLFHNQWTVMTALIIVLMMIGMSGMEPFGAVILVSGSLAQVAYKFGIDPIHFWMLTLVSFELGFLAPPVGLNHLLTRHAVGDREVELGKQEAANKAFWYRHERYLFPVVVMGISMLAVGYGPLIWQSMQ
ncbi:MAG: TRAP transporter large permease subunit [Gammaproteobacteria bacterium]|nr:TRAP transporter large permease subunit [Gammaproteobacteria bacterium]